VLPELVTTIPGPKSLSLAKEAKGSNVWDADGNRFLDMTSAFAVASLGHGRQELVETMSRQANKLLHGMGDVHPNQQKVNILREISRITYERWTEQKGKTILSNSGFEAVETALKSAVMASGKSGIISFENGYHGLGYGALLGLGLKGFSEPFKQQLAEVSTALPFPTNAEQLEQFKDALSYLDPSLIGAVLVEPIQGRGGKRTPIKGFLSYLRDWCDEHKVCLIFDEIYTGFYRTGNFFACEYEGIVPDFICLGKGLSGGFPISACVGKAELMDRWPESSGEAIHTSTFLGHPVGCAMALKAIHLYELPETQQQIQTLSQHLDHALQPLTDLPAVEELRGRGLMRGIKLNQSAVPIMHQLFQEGIFILPDGENASVIALSPPFVTSPDEINHVIKSIKTAIEAIS